MCNCVYVHVLFQKHFKNISKHFKTFQKHLKCFELFLKYMLPACFQKLFKKFSKNFHLYASRREAYLLIGLRCIDGVDTVDID